MAPRIRLDQLIADRGLASSRSRARDMIGRGCVRVDTITAVKAAAMTSPEANIVIDDPASAYVSRAALKLVAGLEASNIDVRGKHCLDLGASTGGFTQVLLERGAAHVIALDVGHGQLDVSVRGHDNVTVLEGFNARNLDEASVGTATQIVVSDLSFVSLTIAAEPALLLAAHPAHAVLLVKPQFEVGRDGVGKGGIVTDDALIDATNIRLQDWFNNLAGWRMTHFLPSPIKGGDGNQEFLLCGERA